MTEKGNFTVTDNSDKIARQIMAAAERAIEAASLHMVGEIKDRAPVGASGELRDTISRNLSNKGGKITAKVGSPKKYAVYVEYGTGEFADNGAGRKGGWTYQAPDGNWYFTRGMKPRKFMREAFRANKQNIETIIKNNMRNA